MTEQRIFTCFCMYAVLDRAKEASLQSGLALLDAGSSKADPLLSFGGLHLLENVVMLVHLLISPDRYLSIIHMYYIRCDRNLSSSLLIY